MTNFIKAEDHAQLSRDLFTVLHGIYNKISNDSLFNLVFDSAIPFGMGSSDTEDQNYMIDVLNKSEVAVQIDSLTDISERKINKK